MLTMKEEATTQLARSLLGAGWIVRLRVAGRSMKPFLGSGSLIRIAPLPSVSPPALGDIVLLRAASGRLVAHRVIELQGETYRTKGDSSGEPDSPVHRSRLVGKVIGIEGPIFLPLDGRVARYIGLLVNRHYPRLVRLKAALKRRLSGNAPRLAGEGS